MNVEVRKTMICHFFGSSSSDETEDWTSLTKQSLRQLVWTCSVVGVWNDVFLCSYSSFKNKVSQTWNKIISRDSGCYTCVTNLPTRLPIHQKPSANFLFSDIAHLRWPLAVIFCSKVKSHPLLRGPVHALDVEAPSCAAFANEINLFKLSKKSMFLNNNRKWSGFTLN
jgi:hypothetical protein